MSQTAPDPKEQPEAELSPREEINRIKQENLTGRQLRIARRLAQKHGLEATSDLDAVRLLRHSGIDPFSKQDVLQLAPASGAGVPMKRNNKLPSAQRKNQQVAKPEPIDEQTRQLEILKIQKDLAKRRRRRMTLLCAKLFAFVALPTILAGYYFYKVATPMYSTFSEFVIQKAESPAAGPASLLGGSPFATSQDSITVQSYLTSRDAMLRLDEEQGFKETFMDEDIDPLQRLERDSTNEAAYKIYKKRVLIGYDPTEGIVKMEVIAPSPDESQRFAEALVRYAEEQVDQMTQRLREDQMKGARENFIEAEEKRQEAQLRVLELQQQRGVVSAEGEVSALMSRRGQMETLLLEKQLELDELLSNPRPNATKVTVLENTIARLQSVVDDLQAQLTQGSDGAESLAKISGELNAAMMQLEIRTAMHASALEQVELAQIEANRQSRYITIGVSPIAPDAPTYPKSFLNTLLAGLVAAGAYLMISLTASILREQVSG